MLSAKSIMTKNVVTVNPQMPIYDALTILTQNKVSGVPVVNDENRVVGMLSEKDVLRILIDKALIGRYSVEDYMSQEVICFSEEDNAIDLCKFFIQSHIRRVPIVNENHLVGIISRRDIVKYILEAKSKMSELRYS